MDSAVEANGLRFKYPRRVVFESLDLRLPTGVHGLLGPNGAGKSTLLNLIATLRQPTGGSLRILNLDPTHRAQRREIRAGLGFLPQSFGYFPSFTVLDFVQYAAWLKQVPAGKVRSQAMAALDLVDMTARASSPLKSLSGGMLRRVGIAHAIVHSPQLVVLDEPTAGLDPEQRIELRELIRRIGGTGTVLLSTHMVEDIGATCEQVVVLDAGRVIFVGTTAGLEQAGAADSAGDTGLEKGYSTVLARARQAAR